jgi:hypothetical protein
VGLARAVAGHAGAWLVLSAVNTLVRAGVQHLLAPEVPRLEVIYVYNLDANLIAYLTLVGVGHALALRDEYTRRAARTLALRAEVAQARLQFLQRQLRPHFLFNALNAVAELAREAPAGRRAARSSASRGSSARRWRTRASPRCRCARSSPPSRRSSRCSASASAAPSP